jgi:hypothetical protein
MKTPLSLICAAALLLTACGGASRSGSINTPAEAPRVTSSTVTFTTLEDGKDAGSAVTVQLVRAGNELAAEVRSAGAEFDDETISPPLAMSVTGPFTTADTQTGSLRIRMTPEGRDTWAFTVRLLLTFSDETQQSYQWTGVKLDEAAPERTLTLAGARL